MEKKEALAIAETRINEIMEQTTDAARMDVVVCSGECIDLYTKLENGPTFFHMHHVTDICRALGLSSWICTDITNNQIRLRVHIY